MLEKMINENNERLEKDSSPLHTDTNNHYNEPAKDNKTYERQNNKWLKLLLWALLIGVILWIILGQKTKNQTPVPTPVVDSTQFFNDSTNSNDTLIHSSGVDSMKIGETSANLH